MRSTLSPPQLEGAGPPSARSPFQRVLVPLDGSPLAERALPFAELVARAFGARTTLLNVLPTPATGRLPINPLEWEHARLHAQRYVEEVSRAQLARGHMVEAVVEQGRPAHRILDFARDHGIDLIVLNSHGEGGPSPWPLSETAQLVVGSAVASVLVVPTSERPLREELRLKRLLVLLDCSPRAEFVLPPAIGLGLETGAQLLLCHVVEEPELTSRLGASPGDLALAAQLTQRNLQEATRYLERICAQLTSAGTDCQVRVLTANHAAEAIQELAQREDVDLILSCAHGGGGKCERPHGSVAGALAHQPVRPLLIVQDSPAIDRPERGQSPHRDSLARGDECAGPGG